MLVPALHVMFHSIWTIGIKRAAFFVGLALVLGLAAEAVSLRGGGFFGGQYTYRPLGPAAFDVPVVVVLYWAVFTYNSYCVTNSFLFWLCQTKPERGQHRFYLVLLLAAADGLLTVAFDFVMDPVQVRLGNWSWMQPGSYFGVPVGNFVGWCLTTLAITGIYRTYEYFRPREPAVGKDIFFIPVLWYGLMVLAFSFEAFMIDLYPVGLLGIALMLLVVAANTSLFLQTKFTGQPASIRTPG
jgi:uncharacterized membrane protein